MRVLDFCLFDTEAMAGEVFEPFVFGGGVGEPFGNHGIEGDGGDVEAVAFEDDVVVFGVVGHFGDGRIGHGGTDGVDNRLLRELAVCQLRSGGEQPHLAAGSLGFGGEMSQSGM